MKISLLPLALLCSLAHANPQISSWVTENSGQYARIYQTNAAETAGITSTTWTRGQGTQSSPTYTDISEVSYSANWVYVRATGLASHIMGPWYLDAAKTQNFPNFPANNAKIYRIPRTPVIPTNKTLTGLGATGIMLNGVSIFDSRDAFSYVNGSSTDATPGNGLTGDGVWNRDGYHNESVTFDPALAHQAGSNYHYHAQPIALRYQLGDHVEYNATTNRYTESSTPVTKHSPILGWAADGLPLYGPYGYSSPLDSNSGVRRMVSGFALRAGLVNRTSLPAWAQRIQTVAFKNGPTVSATYLLGHYIEDFDYLGDLGYTLGTHFDINEQNVRWCVTPEFPSGTYAYFTTINADGTPAFPYTTGRQYFGSPTGGNTTIGETVTISFSGGPNKTTTPVSTAVNNNNATTTWSAVEGGTYTVAASTTLQGWTNLSTTATPIGDDLIVTEMNVLPTYPQRFYTAQRTALASFDSNGFNYTPTGGSGTGNSTAPGGTITRGTTVTVTITLPTTPPQPPVNVIPASITMDGMTGSSISRPTQGSAVATFVVPANATTGLKTIIVTFNPGPTYTMTNAVTFQ
jgi:YHYH protein